MTRIINKGVTSDVPDTSGPETADVDTTGLPVKIVSGGGGGGGSAGTEYTQDTLAGTPAGGALMLVRSDTPASVVSADGDFVAARSTGKGELYVKNLDLEVRQGTLTETAPASDTASSGLNGRLQRIAQRLTSLIGLLPSALGPNAKANSLSITIASDQGNIPVSGLTRTEYAEDIAAATDPVGGMLMLVRRDTPLTTEVSADRDNIAAGASSKGELYVTNLNGSILTGAVTETAPATDTASSGLNGRLQRVSQRLTSLIAQVPATLGAKASSASLAVVLATDQAVLSVAGSSAVVVATTTRPADTTAYAIGDLMANSVTAGSVVPLSLAVARVNAGTGVIRRVRLSTSKTGLAGTETFRVHLFRTSPTVTNGDNGVLAVNGVTALYIGFVDIVMSSIFNDGAKGFTACDYVFDTGAGVTTIYGLLEARVAYTPASAEVFTLQVEVLKD